MGYIGIKVEEEINSRGLWIRVVQEDVNFEAMNKNNKRIYWRIPQNLGYNWERWTK